MERKNKITKQVLILSLFLFISGIIFAPVTVHAAGWLEYAQDLTLGDTVSGSMKTGDYYGLPEVKSGNYYWHIYKISMPNDGMLNMYIESASSEYLSYGYMNYSTKYHGFAIFSYSNPDNLIWRSCGGNENIIERNYSSSRAMYYGSTEIALEQGDYYFVIRRESTIDIPYYLTLSYKEPDINVTSISLDKKSLKLEPGEQAIISANILPENTTNKTLTWESSDSSIASVENGTITACSHGTATITATSSDGEISASCAVTVIDTSAIDKLEESRPAITSISSEKRKLKVYYEPIYMNDVKYQVSYKTSSGKWKTKSITGSPVTIRSLISKKTYYVRVRGYKSIDGSVYYSGWSSIKKAKTK